MLRRLVSKPLATLRSSGDHQGCESRPTRRLSVTLHPIPQGGMQCPTCPARMEKRTNYHLDHYPEKNRDIVKRFKAESTSVNRKRYLDEYNRSGNVRVRCSKCNVRDNK